MEIFLSALKKVTSIKTVIVLAGIAIILAFYLADKILDLGIIKTEIELIILLLFLIIFVVFVISLTLLKIAVKGDENEITAKKNAKIKVNGNKNKIITG